MVRFIGLFIISFLLGFGGVYLVAGNSDQEGTLPAVQEQRNEKQDENQATEKEKQEGTAVTNTKAGGEIFVQSGCIQCHAVSAYDIKRGQAGPDLSNDYSEVPAKHGKSLEEFLKEPTTAVMSSVIKGNPLSDEERKAIVEALKTVSEK
ncbi:hypothetical protein BSNK01_19750 [Bacillaceae bacterium]